MTTFGDWWQDSVRNRTALDQPSHNHRGDHQLLTAPDHPERQARHPLAARPKFPTDPEQMKQLVSQGLTDSAIAKLYGASPEGVRKYRAKHGLPGNPGRAPSTTHQDFIPWEVRKPHTQHPLLERLKDCDKVLKGEPLRNGASTEAFLREWGRWMDGANPTGKKLSVDYDPEDSDGFFLVERKRGDQHRMRMPGPDHPARRQ